MLFCIYFLHSIYTRSEYEGYGESEVGSSGGARRAYTAPQHIRTSLSIFLSPYSLLILFDLIPGYNEDNLINLIFILNLSSN